MGAIGFLIKNIEMMTNNLKIIFFVLVGFLLICNCQKKNDEPVVEIEEMEYPDQEGWNSKVISSKNGVVGANIKYGHMLRFKKRKIVEFDGGISVDFYNEKGVHISNLISEKGRLDEATNNIEAFGNVMVVSDTGITLKTERLRWDNSIEKIVSNDFVTIVTADQDTFYGNGFESDQNLENWHITSFSGKTSRGLDLNFQLEKKRRASDSININAKPDTVTKDTGSIIK